MKRLWIGIGLLAVILVLGFWSTDRLTQIHTEISEMVMDSGDAARAGQWDRADALAREVKEKWENGWGTSASLADHTVLDEIEGLFAQAEVYRESRRAADYAAICARLAAAVDAIQEAHQISWWNLL